MTEQLKNSSEESPAEIGGFNELAEMADNFDPIKAQQERERAMGETASETFDIGDDIKEQIKNDGAINPSTLSPESALQYKKIFNQLLEMTNSNDSASTTEFLEKIKSVGDAGEFFADLYDTMKDMEEMGMPLKPYKMEEEKKPDQNELEYQQKYDALEKRLAELNSNKSIDPEDVYTLIAEYKEISRNAFDPNISEAAENRYRNLVNFSEQLEEINRKSNLL